MIGAIVAVWQFQFFANIPAPIQHCFYRFIMYYFLRKYIRVFLRGKYLFDDI